MEELLRHNLDHVLINIFLRLDGKSLKNVQLVNHEWDNFVRTRIWNSKRNRKIIKDNLWCNSTYSTRHIETGKCITSLSCDNSILVCGFTAGTVNIYHLDSGELIIELRTNSSAEQCTSTQVGLSTSLVAAMSVGTRFKDRTGGILFKIVVWNRVDWSEVTSLESSTRTKFWISDKFLGIRNDDDLVIWKVRKHRDTSIHKYLYIHLKEVPYGNIDVSEHHLTVWNNKQIKWLDLSPNYTGDLTNSTYEKLKPKMLVDQTMYYENYPRLNYEISSEEQAGELPYLNLEEWVEGVECREPVNLNRNSFLLHTQNINTIKSIKVIKQNIMVLTQNNQLFSINTQFKTVTHISRCSDNPCYVVDNGSVMCSVSHRVLNIFYNTAHNHGRICRLNCEEFENICSPLVSLNSTSVIGTSRGGHLVEIFDFWNTNCDTECQH